MIPVQGRGEEVLASRAVEWNLIQNDVMILLFRSVLLPPNSCREHANDLCFVVMS